MTPTNLPTSPVTRAATAEPKPDPTLGAAEQRRRNPDFLARGAITSLANRLPLPWPTPPESRPSPKPRYRSAYLSPDPRSLLGLDEAAWAALDNFDLVLRLVDFSGLRPVLAAKLYRASALGRVPYDPISFFLLFGWQLSNRWNRVETLRHLAEARHSDYVTAFGFRKGLYPSESGYRYFLTTLGKQYLGDLLVQSMNLVQQAGLIPETVQRAATVSFDGQIHDAASRLRCHDVRDSCYQPTSEESSRTCPARQQGKTGCACDTLACREVCKLATPRDQPARYIWYAGHNRGERPDDPAAVALDNSTPSAAQSPNQSPNRPSTLKGEEHYGYRSLPSQLVDPVQRLSWTLDEAELAPANTREERPAGELLRQVVGEYPWLAWATRLS
jgi:hypothetical protein